MYEDIIQYGFHESMSSLRCNKLYEKNKHEVDVSYDKAWSAYELALNLVHGSPKSSYSLLLAFSNALIENNLGN